MSVVGKREAQRLLQAGRNCWRIERARRVGFLIDGAAYFAALRPTLARARSSIFILGWDFDSRTRLVPGGAGDGWPEPLGEFLEALVRSRRTLHIYVLSWDFATVFAKDREWAPLYKLGWRTQPAPRLSFRLDAHHPPGGSHHQKVVVVDDAVAFVGGLDLTHGRWDTPDHRRDQPYRVDVRGQPSRPYHDVQAIVDGDAARALGELCRSRWRAATKRDIGPARGASDPWPQEVAAELVDVDVAIARTDPGYVSGRPITEIRQLYIDAIATAQRMVYLENQYFSSSVVGAAIESRLREQNAPEVVVVSRLTEEGWLESQTMGVLRARLHRRLQAADVHDRYRLLYPHVPELEAPNLLNVHSKVLIADDDLCSVGSANFNNRSMGFDTECNIAIEACGQARIRHVIAGLRERLLAEHLDVQPEQVAAEMRRNGSLIRTIEALHTTGRTLEPIDAVVTTEAELLVSAAAIIDPERPADPEALVRELVPPDAARPMAARFVGAAFSLLALAALAALWRWTPFAGSLEPRALAAAIGWAAASGYAGVVVLAMYVVSGLVAFPLTLLMLATLIVFGPLKGMLYALGGALLSAAITYCIGRMLGRDAIRRLAGDRLNSITSRLTRRGVMAIATARLLPIAPFSVVNAVAGASHVELGSFLLGTVLGLLPGLGVMALLVDRIGAVMRAPGWGSVGWLALASAVVAAAAVRVWRRFM
ncbi:MAG: VTT domain-containing protein [Steroidobacteraceae bacterium]|nr:VTT domain-containing protein [Steroidobacteraceae bacterium]